MASILVVDDSISMRKMVRFALETAGHAIIDAENGEAALQAAQEAQVDMIITDKDMPEMNGIELARALRTIPDYKTSPIIMLTTEGLDSEKAEGKAAGVTGWIVKPFQPDKLIAVVTKEL